jgi:pyruvyltransferase
VISAYWWSPSRDPRTLAVETLHNHRAWLHMAQLGGRLSNFGDELSKLAIEEATGVRVRWRNVQNAQVVGIGSILNLYLSRSGAGLIWGTGARNPDRGQLPAGLSERVLAVRGSLTRASIGLDHTVPLGDPGLLSRAIFGPTTVARGGVLVIPHFSVFNTRDGRAEIEGLRASGMEILPPSAPVREVCSRIGKAGLLLTSSLHGLVVGDALGTPTVLVTLGQSQESAFKYDDYLSIYGESAHFTTINELTADAALTSARETAAERAARISLTVDSTVEGLIAAARPLR